MIKIIWNNGRIGDRGNISEKQISYANKKYRTDSKKFLQFDKVIPFEDNSFDSVSMIELIEHLSDDEIANLFQQIYRVLKKGGKIYITTPNYLSLWPILEFFLNKIWLNLIINLFQYK